MLYEMQNGTLLPAALVLGIVLLAIWSAVIKGFALWRAARRGHKGWFIALLLINTLGVLEIIYIFFVAREDRASLSAEERAQ